MYDELIDSIKNKNIILFVGAGVSATLNLPTWSNLINELAKDLKYDPKIFKRYGNNLILAEFYKLKKEGINDLTKWMSQNWNIKKSTIKSSKTHEYITKLDFPIIYTTNYDHCLETSFQAWEKEYNKIIGVNDFVNLDLKTQIVKFHGDMDLAESIVFTENSYFDRINFNSSLDIKLRFDMLGKSILFIGYSLSDINIRILIYKLNELWKKGNHRIRPKSYIFLPNPNPIQELVFQKRGITPIIGEDLNKTKSMEKFLYKLYRGVEKL